MYTYTGILYVCVCVCINRTTKINDCVNGARPASFVRNDLTRPFCPIDELRLIDELRRCFINNIPTNFVDNASVHRTRLCRELG